MVKYRKGGEGAVRTAIKDLLGHESLFWVEWGRGGTPGMPDCFFIFDKVLVPIELKVGIASDFQFMNGSQFATLKAEVRPEQNQVARRMLANGVIVYFAIGEIDTPNLWLGSAKNLSFADGNFWIKRCINVTGDEARFCSYCMSM